MVSTINGPGPTGVSPTGGTAPGAAAQAGASVSIGASGTAASLAALLSLASPEIDPGATGLRAPVNAENAEALLLLVESALDQTANRNQNAGATGRFGQARSALAAASATLTAAITAFASDTAALATDQRGLTADQGRLTTDQGKQAADQSKLTGDQNGQAQLQATSDALGQQISALDDQVAGLNDQISGAAPGSDTSGIAARLVATQGLLNADKTAKAGVDGRLTAAKGAVAADRDALAADQQTVAADQAAVASDEAKVATDQSAVSRDIAALQSGMALIASAAALATSLRVDGDRKADLGSVKSQHRDIAYQDVADTGQLFRAKEVAHVEHGGVHSAERARARDEGFAARMAIGLAAVLVDAIEVLRTLAASPPPVAGESGARVRLSL